MAPYVDFTLYYTPNLILISKARRLTGSFKDGFCSFVGVRLIALQRKGVVLRAFVEA